MPSCALAGKSECLKRRMCLQAQPTDSQNIIVMTMMIINFRQHDDNFCHHDDNFCHRDDDHRCDFVPDLQHGDGVGRNLRKRSCLCLVQDDDI